MEDTQEHKESRIDFNDKSYEWGDIKNESEYERYDEELEKCYRRYCPLRSELQSNMERFSELRKTLDALREKKDDNKDYNKTPEYLVRHHISELFLFVDKSESPPRNIHCVKLIREIFKCHCQFGIKEAKAKVLKYHLEFTNNPHLVAIDEEHCYLQKKLKYIVQKMSAWNEANK